MNSIVHEVSGFVRRPLDPKGAFLAAVNEGGPGSKGDGWMAAGIDGSELRI